MDINQFLVIMMIAVIVAILAKYIRWPYTIVLLISGLVVAAVDVEAPFALDRDLIFHILQDSCLLLIRKIGHFSHGFCILEILRHDSNEICWWGAEEGFDRATTVMTKNHYEFCI